MTAIRRVSEIAILVLILLAQGLSGYAYNILSIGDSLTEGLLEGYPPYSYRDSLYNQLSSHNYQFDFIGPNSSGAFADNQYLGKGGTRIDTDQPWNPVVPGLGTQLSTGRTYVEVADVVLVHIGTNDLARDWETPIPIDYFNQLKKVITELVSYNPNVDILLAQIIKSRNDFGGIYPGSTWGRIESYNDLIGLYSWKSDAALSSWKGIIKLVDMENVLNYTSDFKDIYHPTNEGYDKMGLAWYSALQDPELLGAPVPLPIPGVLLASGIMGLVAIRRRFKS